MKEEKRIKTVSTAAGSAMKATMDKGVIDQETATDADMDIVVQIIKQWGSMLRKSANQMIENYGPPQEAVSSQLI